MADESISPKRTAGTRLDAPSSRRRRTSKPEARGETRGQVLDVPAVPVDPRPVRPADRIQRIARRAYELYEARGAAAGDEMQDWLEAERQIDAEDASLDRE